MEIEGNKNSFEDAVKLCYDNAEVINAITFFNNHFSYGMTLQSEDVCLNPECPSNLKTDEEEDKNKIISL
jgi:hypothetical protein